MFSVEKLGKKHIHTKKIIKKTKIGTILSPGETTNKFLVYKFSDSFYTY